MSPRRRTTRAARWAKAASSKGVGARALLAVDLYYRAASEGSREGLVVHTHMAWLYLHHARFRRDKVDYRYRRGSDRVNDQTGRLHQH
jgi:hypothetical protein